MRSRLTVLVFFFIAIALTSSGQTPAAASTCADLHLVPAARECTAVATIPVGDLGFFVTALDSAEDGFAAEDLIEQSLGKRSVHADAPFIRLERAETDEAKALLAVVCSTL